MKQNINIEAEGSELVLKNKAGDYVIIPKKYRTEVQDMIKDNCHNCIDKLVETLPMMEDYAQDGSIIPSWNKVKSVLNPKNWGVTDYTEYGSFGNAYEAARKAGEKEFMWNNQRKSTDIPYSNKLNEYISNNVYPYGSFSTSESDFKTDYDELMNLKYYTNGIYTPNKKLHKDDFRKIIRNRRDESAYDVNKSKGREGRAPTFGHPKDLNASYDALYMFNNQPQKFNSFRASKYKPSNSENPNTKYYSFNDKYTKQIEDDLFKYDNRDFIDSNKNKRQVIKSVIAGASLKDYQYSKGKDDRGDYVAYYDINDYGNILDIIPNTNPFEIYGRIYYKDYGDGQKKRMYYTDNELSQLDVNKKNFDTLALQRELSNRGYKLPKSTKKDGTFDGVWGDEIKNALLEYRKSQMKNYAFGGSLYPSNTKVKVNQNNQIKEYDISSKGYSNLYNSGKLMGYNKNTDTYIATPLKEATITAEAPQWLKYKRDYEKTNPKSNYINSYLTPFAKALGNTKTNYPKRLDDEYEQKSLDYVSEQLVKNKPQGKLSRVKWLNQMSNKEEEIIKRNPKYQSSLWADTKRGLTSLVEQNPLQAFQNILNSSDYTNREKQEMLKDYAYHPVMSKLGDATKILNPLTVPSKMIQSTYKNDYSFSDALKGKKNNAGIVEDIVTDPLNLVGAGLLGKISKADKVIDATKVGSKVLNKTDDAVNNINRIKFDDFKNDNEFFRIIVGDEAFDDIVQTQKIRTKQPSSVKNTPPNTINLDRRGSTAFPSFSKGSPSLSYANDNPNHYIIRTADESIKPSTSGRHGKGTTMFPTDKSGKHLTELDASKVQVYKHVGNGEYELVNTAKSK